jgi:hypothetical protein
LKLDFSQRSERKLHGVQSALKLLNGFLMLLLLKLERLQTHLVWVWALPLEPIELPQESGVTFQALLVLCARAEHKKSERTREQIDLIADWLRGEWYRPAQH